MTTSDLRGRVALVTGASRNIGQAIAEALGANGASVIVHTHSDTKGAQETVRRVEAAGGKAIMVLGDLSDPKIPQRIIDEGVSAFGRLDILVANAAVRPEGILEDVTYEDWRKVMALALDSVFLLAKAALAPLRQSDLASIVTIGGITAHLGASSRVHVVTAKAGLVGLTKALAHDLGPDGITVNCVSPGLIETKRIGQDPKHHAERTNPLGRHGTPAEVASAVTMLVGANSRYITGQTIHVNGGALMV
ncbi:SDR family oxidoreductase [Mesorhizobium sp. SB112]|uniref:SDR family NAD(P)-dependent oxidoreductase n=1 Tax=Mesorhizobium sp. SB112 TaxID=3151853 RepID=UPI0032672D45